MSRDLNYRKGSLYGAFAPDVFLLIRLGKRLGTFKKRYPSAYFTLKAQICNFIGKR